MSFFLVWRVRLCLRDTWDPFQLNPVGAEKEEKRRCFLLAQYLVAVIVGLAVLTSAVISKVYIYSRVRGWTRGFGKRFGSPRKCWKSISHSKCEFNPWSTTIIATRSIISKKKKKRMSFEKEAPLLCVTSLNSLATFQNRAPSWCCRRSPVPLQCEAQRRNSSTHWCWFSASSAPTSWSLSNPCGDVPSRALCDQT